jgi:hypothetical protein
VDRRDRRPGLGQQLAATLVVALLGLLGDLKIAKTAPEYNKYRPRLSRRKDLTGYGASLGPLWACAIG